VQLSDPPWVGGDNVFTHASFCSLADEPKILLMDLREILDTPIMHA